MSTSLIVVALGAVIAAIGTGVLAARCARSPGLGLVALTLAAFALAVGLGSQTLGYLAGYSALIFRAMELGTQALAPLALCLALAELVAMSVPGRFAMRLIVSAFAIIVLVIAGTDPLNPGASFSSKFPDPLVHYELVPHYLLELTAVLAALTAVTAALLVLVRSRRDAGGAAVQPVLAAAAAAVAVAVPGLSWLAAKYAGLTLPLPGRAIFALTGTAAAGLTWIAAVTADRAGLTERRGRPARPADGDDWPDPEADFGSRLDDRAFDHYGGPGRGDYHEDWSEPGAQQRRSDPDAEARYPALAAFAAEAIEPADGPYTGDIDGHQPPPEADPDVQLFGQIAIYTLLEDRLEDFDRLTERIVAKVRASEPNTLAFIVHAVPTAPMQRIMYEVYRDRAAYEEHLRQPYVIRYETERRPFVLATNLIELGLQHAKVSPFPSISAISDILSESGIDLTGVTGSPQPQDRLGMRELPPAGRGGAGRDGRGNGVDHERDGADRRRDGRDGRDYQRPYGGWAEIRSDDDRYQ